MAIEKHIHAFPRHVEGKIYPEAVPVYDPGKKTVRIGDGITPGGIEMPGMADFAELSGKLTALENAVNGFEESAMAILGEEETEAV